MKYLMLSALLLMAAAAPAQVVLKGHSWYCAKHTSLGDTKGVNRSNLSFEFGYDFVNTGNEISGRHYHHIPPGGIVDCSGKWTFKGDELTLYGNDSDCKIIRYKIVATGNANFSVWIDMSSQEKYYMVSGD